MEEIKQDTELYYTAPEQEIFEDIKANALVIWAHSYALEKITKVMNMQNVQDNYMYILAMFDHINQCNMATMLKLPSLKRIRAVMPEDKFSMINESMDRQIQNLEGQE